MFVDLPQPCSSAVAQLNDTVEASISTLPSSSNSTQLDDSVQIIEISSPLVNSTETAQGEPPTKKGRSRCSKKFSNKKFSPKKSAVPSPHQKAEITNVELLKSSKTAYEEVDGKVYVSIPKYPKTKRGIPLRIERKIYYFII